MVASWGEVKRPDASFERLGPGKKAREKTRNTAQTSNRNAGASVEVIRTHDIPYVSCDGELVLHKSNIYPPMRAGETDVGRRRMVESDKETKRTLVNCDGGSGEAATPDQE
jgi:hypothetical protein